MAAATPIADQAVYPILASRRVMALRHWANYRALCGDKATVTIFTPETLTEWMSRLDDLDKEKAEGTDHPLPRSIKEMGLINTVNNAVSARLRTLTAKTTRQ